MIFPRPPIAVFLLCAAALAPVTAFARAHPTRPATVADSDAYKGAIIMDATTGKVLFEDNADLVNAPASMVKLMTFAVLHDKLASGAITLATPVTVNRAEARFAMKKDSTSVWLKEKEVFSVEELIYAMMIQSANDAALALSRVAGGTPEAFVVLMNAKAHELGMTHSVFCTPHGLITSNAPSDARDLTTARDYALLCRHLLLHTDILKYTSVKERTFGAGQRAVPTKMTNHNHLLGKIAGVDGLKTGYTIPAGFCLATTVQRNSQRIIIVTLGGTSSKSRDLKVAELIERGFAALPPGSPPFTTQAGPAPEPSPITAAPVHQPAGSPDIKFTLPPPKK
jgi:D-alanyl-D-alanine carboxypeptidase